MKWIALGGALILLLAVGMAWLILWPPSVTRSSMLSGREQIEPNAALRKVISVRGDADSVASLMTYLTCQPGPLGPDAKATVKGSLRVSAEADGFVERTVEVDSRTPNSQAMLAIRTSEAKACLASGCRVEVTCQLVAGPSGVTMTWKTESRGIFRLPKVPTFSEVGWVTAVEARQ